MYLSLELGVVQQIDADINRVQEAINLRLEGILPCFVRPCSNEGFC